MQKKKTCWLCGDVEFTLIENITLGDFSLEVMTCLDKNSVAIKLRHDLIN